VSQAIASHSFEFHQQGIDFGYSYQSAAVVGDGSPPPTPIDAVRIYEPSTVRAVRCLIAWVEREGKRLPLDH